MSANAEPLATGPDVRQLPESRFVRWAIAAYVLILAYASLAPFVGWQQPRGITLFDWPRYITHFDVFINVVAYAPLGALISAQLQHPLAPIPRNHRYWWRVIGIAVAAGCSLSFGLELLQAFLPGRVSSPLDLLANTVGTAFGALALLIPFGRRTVRMTLTLRQRHFSDAPLTDWGILLLVLWLMAQLNPAIPFFEAGMLAGQSAANTGTVVDANTSYDPLILFPQVVGISLNVAAFAMFVSVLTHPNRPSLPRVVVILAIGFFAKLTMASLLLKTPQLVSSLSPATVIGVTSGLLVHLLFTKLSYRWRAFWAAMFVFAGGVMAKLASVYTALDSGAATI